MVAIPQMPPEPLVDPETFRTCLRHVPGAIDGMGTAKLIVAAAAAWLLMSLIPPGLRVGASLLVACASAIPLVQLWRERRIQVK